MYLGFTFIMRLMAKHMGGGLGGFGKSNAKVYMEKTTGVTFADVAGQDEAKSLYRKLLTFFITLQSTIKLVLNSQKVLYL